MKRIAMTVFVLASAAFVPVAMSQDLALGKATWDRLNCASCHGADGGKAISPTYPILAGQHAGYLSHALTAYQRGARGLPPTANVRNNAIMSTFAMQMDKQDIRNVSAWLASQPSPLAVRK